VRGREPSAPSPRGLAVPARSHGCDRTIDALVAERLAAAPVTTVCSTPALSDPVVLALIPIVEVFSDVPSVYGGAGLPSSCSSTPGAVRLEDHYPGEVVVAIRRSERRDLPRRRWKHSDDLKRRSHPLVAWSFDDQARLDAVHATVRGSRTPRLRIALPRFGVGR